MEVLRSITKLWLSQIKKAKEHKKATFGKTANTLRKYFNTRERYIVNPNTEDAEDRPFMGKLDAYHKIAIGKVGEWVRLMLPYCSYKAPNRLVSSRTPAVPPELFPMVYGTPAGTLTQAETNARIQSFLLTHTLNYASEECTFDLRGESRSAVKEALLVGRGVAWCELIDLNGGEFPGSFADSVDYLYLDPDAQNIRTATWCVRERRRHVWQVAEDFGIPQKELEEKVSLRRSNAKDASDDAYGEDRFNADGTERQGDVCVYYEVFSRCGLGHKIVGSGDEIREHGELFDSVGDNVYLVIVPGMEYPLNLQPDWLGNRNDSEIKLSLDWPIKFWGDFSDPWPFTACDFYPNGLWPKAPLEDALPLQAFLDYAYSYMMDRIKTTCRDIIVCDPAINQELRGALKGGLDQQIVEMKGVSKSLNEVINILQFPQVTGDLWSIVSAVEQVWEKNTGLMELLYGGQAQRQMRSAAEAQIRQSNLMVRPNDLADQVEAWHAALARKEATAQRLVVRESVAYVLGESQGQAPGVPGPLTQAWQQLVATDDPYVASSELTYTVEAGSGRRKNLAKILSDIQDSSQMILPIAHAEYQRTGDPTQLNAWMNDWATAMQVDPNRYMYPDLRAQMQVMQRQAQMTQPPVEMQEQQPIVQDGIPSEAMLTPEQISEGETVPYQGV